MISGLRDRAHGAGPGASAAVDAGAGVDHILGIPLRDRAHRAGIRTGTAADAGVADDMSHDKYTSLRMYLHSTTTFQKSKSQFCRGFLRRLENNAGFYGKGSGEENASVPG